MKKVTSYQNVPMSLIKHAGRNGLWNDLLKFIEFKFGVSDNENNGNGGNSIIRKDLESTDSKLPSRFVRLGWAGESDTHFFIRGWKFLERKYGRSRRVRFFRDFLFLAAKMGMNTVCFWIVSAFMMRIHSKGSVSTRSDAHSLKRTHTRELQESEHNGGVSLSLLADCFGKSKQWASQMRMRASKCNLLSFERRYSSVSRYEAAGMEYNELDTIVFNMKGRGNQLFREITSSCEVLRSVEFKWK